MKSVIKGYEREKRLGTAGLDDRKAKSWYFKLYILNLFSYIYVGFVVGAPSFYCPGSTPPPSRPACKPTFMFALGYEIRRSEMIKLYWGSIWLYSYIQYNKGYNRSEMTVTIIIIFKH
jgi:hypothetical protein